MDEDPLQQHVENLFTNEIEHGGENVTDTVNAHDPGFSIKDDGPGILWRNAKTLPLITRLAKED